jgi:hypothetical protein
LRQSRAYPTGQGQDERAMGQWKEALRASVEAGPRAALTWRGAAEVQQPGEKHGLGERQAVSLLREVKRSGARGIGMEMLTSHNQANRKLVQRCLRFPLDFATYRWAATRERVRV